MKKIVKIVLSIAMSATMVISFSGCVGSEYLDIFKQLIEDAGVTDYFGGSDSTSSKPSSSASSGKEESDSSTSEKEESSSGGVTGDPVNGYCPDSPDGTHLFNVDADCVYCDGHICDYRNLIEKVDATCGVKGKEIYQCYKCNATEERELEALSHLWESYEYAGKPNYKCEYCGSLKWVEI